MTRDVVLGSILLAISTAYYLGAAAIPDSDLADAVGPTGLPRVYAVLLAVFALVLMARAVRARRALPAGTAPDRTGEPPRTLGRLAALLTIGILYIVIVPTAGYPITIAALMVATALYHAGSAPAAATRSRHSPAQVLLVGIAGAGLLWLVFVVVLRIPQPPGIWSTFW